MERWLSERELIEAVAPLGRVTRSQLARGRRDGLLPRLANSGAPADAPEGLRRPGFGRARGTKTFYSPATLKQLSALLRIRGRLRKLPRVNETQILRVLLWLEGYPIPLDKLRDSFRELLHVDRRIPEGSATIDGADNAEIDRIDASRVQRHPLLRLLRRGARNSRDFAIALDALRSLAGQADEMTLIDTRDWERVGGLINVAMGSHGQDRSRASKDLQRGAELGFFNAEELEEMLCSQGDEVLSFVRPLLRQMTDQVLMQRALAEVLDEDPPAERLAPRLTVAMLYGLPIFLASVIRIFYAAHSGEIHLGQQERSELEVASPTQPKTHE